MPYPVGMATGQHSKVVGVQVAGASARKPKCFVIIQIGKEGSDVRLKSNRVMKYIVERALEDKYDVQRADDIKRPGTVTVQIIEQLLEAPLVVADLSDFNANVYYELAIRHAVKKPVIHLITKGQEAPFDVNQMRYVSYDITAIESVEEAREELRQNVEAIEKGEGGLLTPIQFTQFVLAAESGQAGSRDTGVIMNAVGTAMSNISEELKSIKELVARNSESPSGPIFSSPKWSSKNNLANLLESYPPITSSPDETISAIARATAAKLMSPEETMGVIAKALARDAESAEWKSREEAMRLAAEAAAKLYDENEKHKK